MEAPGYGTAPIVLAVGSDALLPLPQLLGGTDPAGLRPGDAISPPLFGAGEVRSVAAGSIEIELAGGELRRFGWAPQPRLGEEAVG